MTKDRLGDLQKIAKTKPVDRTADVEMGGENDSLALSHFLAQVADTRLSIDDVDSTVTDIKRIHADILSSLTNDNDLRATLEKKLESIKVSSKEAKAKLKSLETELVKSKISLKSPILSFGGNRRKSSASSISTADHIKRTQYNALLQRFSAVMSEYNQVQVRYRESCKSRIQKQLKVAGREVDFNELDEMIESQSPGVFTQGIISATRQAKLTLEDVEARYGDILKLEKNIVELHDLFVELANQVSGQGEMVDNVEACVNEAKEHVTQGAQQTREALTLKRKALKKKFICGGIIVVVVIVIIVIIAMSI